MRLAASILSAAMTLLLFTTCLSGVEMTREQKACCAAMAHDCGQMAIETSCCAGEGQGDEGLAAAKPTFSTFSFGFLMPAIAAPTVLAIPNGRVLVADRTPLRPIGVPTYLFVSSFRI